MSLLHYMERIKTESLSPKRELIKEEIIVKSDDNTVPLNHIERVKEDFEDENIYAKVEDEISIKEEIKEFIDKQFDQKYNEKSVYSSLLWDKSRAFKELPREGSEGTNKCEKTVYPIQCVTNEVKYGGKETCYSKWEKGAIKEEVQCEEPRPSTDSPNFSLSNENRLKMDDEESLDLKKDDSLHCGDTCQAPPTLKFSCSYCNLQFKLRHGLKIHTLKEHSKQVNYHCKTCKDSFNLEKELKQHNILYHRESIVEKEKAYSCSECPEKFHFPRGLEIHMMMFHKTDKMRCCHCLLTFVKKSALKYHMNSHKAIKYLCKVCGKVFKFKSNLDRHTKIHSGDKPYKCNICSKAFSRLDHFKLHKHYRQLQEREGIIRENSQESRIIHREETLPAEKFVCEICGFGFRVKQSLRDHLKRHSENRPHVCKVCNKAFKQMYNLNQHLLSHDGPRDFVCDVCKKGFRRKAFLKQHMLVHTKEKNYMCELCGKKYYKSCHVTEHKKKIHENLELKQGIPSIAKMPKK